VSRFPRIAILIATSVVALAFSASAPAANLTLGSPLSGTFNSLRCKPDPCTVAQSALPAGSTAVSPVNGIIVRWRLLGGNGAFKYKLRVLGPAAPGFFTGAGTSAPATPETAAVEAFSTALPVHAGQMIGVDLEAEAPLAYRETLGGQLEGFKPPLADGATAPGFAESSVELGFNAEVQPAPTIATVAPASGSIKGGTSVTINGADLEGTSAVSFGGNPAASYIVNSAGQITAVAPPSTKVAKVNLTLSTVAGTGTSAQTFAYEGCVVPKLKGSSLKAGRKKLKKADCRLGKVRGERTKSAKVKKQSAKPGKVLAPGSKVAIKLG
jgi:hypothetical protein